MTLAFSLFSKEGFHWLFRWWHVVFGVAWIGLLYYFNYVQVPAFATMDAPVRNSVIDKLVPRALWYFRFAAAATAVTGIIMIALYADNYKYNYGQAIYSGALIGLIMLYNVWMVIWPKQQIVIANARGLLEDREADPATADAGRRALIASRTNSVLSIPMLMFMTGAQNFLGQSDPVSPAIIYWIIFLAVVGALEANALGFIGGVNGPGTKPLGDHKNIAYIGVPVALLFLIVWLIF